jgi:polysaccharide pyruvyl transferase WcaK-like protein
MYQVVSILRACHMMASSRYHGIVTSMPGLVPSAGITMDERIRNLMRERGHPDLLMNVDDDDLEERLLAALEQLYSDGEAVAAAIGKTVVRNLKLMARMGVHFEEEVQRRYPDFPTRTGTWSWEDYLPPMYAGLHELVEEFESAETRKTSVAS